jgi:predicted DNA-binding transcriptional regulator YafY
LANDYKRANPSIYALDRIEWLEETEETFDFPADFDTEKFFKDCYGVICGTDKEPQRIVIRAYAPLTNYLRTLPLHHSQKELNTTAEYSDFEFYLRPTFDFLQELLSKGKEVEVLEPASFRQEIIDVLKLVMSRHQ